MKLSEIRKLKPGEVDLYWPGYEGRWNYLAICKDVPQLQKAFDLEDLIGGEAYKEYKPVITHRKLDPQDEAKVVTYLGKHGFNVSLSSVIAPALSEPKAKEPKPNNKSPVIDDPDRVIEQLERLAKLLRQGVINDKEFALLKTQIINVR